MDGGRGQSHLVRVEKVVDLVDDAEDVLAARPHLGADLVVGERLLE